jgi:hypothetical protein
LRSLEYVAFTNTLACEKKIGAKSLSEAEDKKDKSVGLAICKLMDVPPEHPDDSSFNDASLPHVFVST